MTERVELELPAPDRDEDGATYWWPGSDVIALTDKGVWLQIERTVSYAGPVDADTALEIAAAIAAAATEYRKRETEDPKLTGT